MPILGSLEDQEHKRALYGPDQMPTTCEDLHHYLVGEFRQGEPMRITIQRTDAVGLAISDRMVSRLEVLNAATGLRYRQRRIVELLYESGLCAEVVATRLHISRATLYRERDEAMAIMAATIYDWLKV